MPVTGQSALKRRLLALSPALRAQVAEAVEEAGKAVLADMKNFAPTDTGALRSALTLEISKGGLGVAVGFPRKGLASDFFYGRFIEYGTKGGSRTIRRRKTGKVVTVTWPARPARPFMKPALDVNRRNIRNAIGQAIRRALKQAARA